MSAGTATTLASATDSNQRPPCCRTIGAIANRTCEYLKPSDGFKNWLKTLELTPQWCTQMGYQTGDCLKHLSGAAREVSIFIAPLDTIGKTKDVFAPLPQYSIHNPEQQASVFEQFSKKAAQISSILASLPKTVEFCKVIQLFSYAKELAVRLKVFSAFTMVFAAQGINEEVTKLYRGVLVNTENGHTRDINPAEERLCKIKIVMNFALFMLGLLALATALGMVIPHVLTIQIALMTTATTTSVWSWYQEKLNDIRPVV